MARSFWTSICAAAGKYKVTPVSLAEKAGISKEVYKTWTSKMPTDEEIDRILEAMRTINPAIVVTKEDLLNGMATVLIPEDGSFNTEVLGTAETKENAKKVKTSSAKGTKKDADAKLPAPKSLPSVNAEKIEDEVKMPPAELPTPAVSENITAKKMETPKRSKQPSAPRSVKQNAATLQKEITRQTQEFVQQLVDFVKSAEDHIELSAKEKELIGYTKKMSAKDLDMLLAFAKRLV